MDNTKYEEVADLVLSKKELLSYTEEDSKLLLKLWNSYWKKKNGRLNSDSLVLAASILWCYSSDNYLWEHDKKWTQKRLAELFKVRGKTISNNTTEIKRMLKIKLWDDRFCRKEIAEDNPLKQIVMLENGLINTRNQAVAEQLFFAPLKKTKEDYYYDGCDWLESGKPKKAISCFKKALTMDNTYVEAWNGLGTVYFENNFVKSKEYFQKAYELTEKQFNKKFPKHLNWGILENRQYLRAIHYLGLMLWREGNTERAKELFMQLLKLNPCDNQGIRYVVAAVYAGLSWEQMDEDRDKEEKLLKEQNKKHNFWKWKED